MLSLFIAASSCFSYSDLYESISGLLTADKVSINLGTQKSRSESFESGYYTVNIGTQSDLELEVTKLSIVEADLGTQATLKVKGPIILIANSGTQSNVEVIATDNGCPIIFYSSATQASLSLKPDSFTSGTYVFGLATRALQDDISASSLYARGKIIASPSGEFNILNFEVPEMSTTFKAGVAAVARLLGQETDSELIFVEFSSNLGIIIGVVVAVVVIACAVGGFILFRRYKNKEVTEAPTV